MGESDTELNFGFDLQPTGDEGSTFRYRNTPDQVQRPIVVDRHTSMRSDLSVQGNLVTVVHGELASDGQKATLIVARFQFMGSHHSRRFNSAGITFRFRDEKDPPSCSVFKIAPSGEYALNPSSLQQQSTWGVGGSAGVNAIATASGQATYQLAKTFDCQDRGSFYGSIKTEGRNFGPKNTARWSMSQNKSQKSGIPALLHVAVLLKRQHDKPFYADIKVNAEVDILYKLESRIQDVSGSNKIDPIKFDPACPQMGDIPKGLNAKNLLKYPLADLGGVEITPSLYTVASVLTLKICFFGEPEIGTKLLTYNLKERQNVVVDVVKA